MLYLFNMLNDRQNQVGSAAALLLSNIIKSRGDTLRNEVIFLDFRCYWWEDFNSFHKLIKFRQKCSWM